MVRPKNFYFGFVYKISFPQTLETLQLVFEYSDHGATRFIIEETPVDNAPTYSETFGIPTVFLDQEE